MDKFLVTGAKGFLGRALCKALLKQGKKVCALVRSADPELEQLGVVQVLGDLARFTPEMRQAFKSVDCVFHVAAKVEMWGKWPDFWDSNVVATRNVIQSCREAGVPRLVFTSSPSVVANGRDLNGINEDYPYPEHFEAYYPHTKAISEQEVLAANNESLKTIALRPHLIFGPGDTNLFPTILAKADAGRLVQIGAGLNKTDCCFIDDCVEAHLKAAEAIQNRPEIAAGKAYFISQGEPILLWQWINQILRQSGRPEIKKKISFKLAKFIATSFEISAKLFKFEPPLTKFLITEMATSHYFSIQRAKDILGFEPQFNIAQAMEKTFGSESTFGTPSEQTKVCAN